MNKDHKMLTQKCKIATLIMFASIFAGDLFAFPEDGGRVGNNGGRVWVCRRSRRYYRYSIV